MGAKGLTILVLALAFGATLISPLIGSTMSATETKHVENETLTVETGTWQGLDGHSLVGDSETVFAFNQTSGDFEEAEKGTDYQFNYSHGRIKPLNSSLVDDGDEMKVSYDWKLARGPTALIINLLPLVVALLMVAMAGNHIGRQT